MNHNEDSGDEKIYDLYIVKNVIIYH